MRKIFKAAATVLCAALLAAGAAAAAFTAYSARRTALARERKDAPDDRP